MRRLLSSFHFCAGRVLDDIGEHQYLGARRHVRRRSTQADSIDHGDDRFPKILSGFQRPSLHGVRSISDHGSVYLIGRAATLEMASSAWRD